MAPLRMPEVDDMLHWREIYSVTALVVHAPEQAHSQPLSDGNFTTTAVPGFAASDANDETSERSCTVAPRLRFWLIKSLSYWVFHYFCNSKNNEWY